MSYPRKLYDALMGASVAYARWDYEVSMAILQNKKKLLLLVLMALPIVGISIAEASGMLGGKTSYTPAFYSTNIFVVSIAIGLAAGLITRAIGAGGGFIITPALMAAGVKGILAVGTDVFHIFAKAIKGTVVHRKLGHVSLKLALAFLAGSAGGTVIGGTINKTLYNIDPLLSNAFISLLYTVLLGFLGFYALGDFLKHRKCPLGGGAHGHQVDITPLAVKLQSVNIQPMIRFDEDHLPKGRQISGVFVAIGGLVVGMLAALMGVGGGFVTFPMFVFVFGVSASTTVGTDILQIIFMAGIASVFQYAIYGYVFYTLAVGMLIGSLIGIQVGALTTKAVRGVHICGFYATTILAGFINRASVLPGQMVELGYLDAPRAVVAGIEFAGNVVFWVVVGIFGAWVFWQFFSNLRLLRDET